MGDIKREYNMDEDLKASGYNKQVEKDLEEELRPDDCNSEDENSQNEESQEDESENEEEEQEEEKEEEKPKEIKKEKTSSRLDTWLDSHQNEDDRVDEVVELTAEE